MTTGAGLRRRGNRTALACWTAIARGAAGAAVLHRPGVGMAVFPDGPEREVYNNAILEEDLPEGRRTAAVDVMEAEYAAAGIERYAAWTHESDRAMRRELERRGYTVAETTRAMGMTLDAIRSPHVQLDLAPPDWREYLRVLELPPGLLEAVDPADFRVAIARHEGAAAATGMAFDHDGDCGIFNVGTREPARRHGLATALTTRLVLDARDRGCETATLQATHAAERVYASVGFCDLGSILEYAAGSRELRPRTG